MPNDLQIEVPFSYIKITNADNFLHDDIMSWFNDNKIVLPKIIFKSPNYILEFVSKDDLILFKLTQGSWEYLKKKITLYCYQ